MRSKSTGDPGDTTQVCDALEQKKQYLQQKAQARIDTLETKREKIMSEEQFKEWLEVPAYLRRDIQLQPITSLPEQGIARYQLDDNKEKDTETKEKA